MLFSQTRLFRILSFLKSSWLGFFLFSKLVVFHVFFCLETGCLECFLIRTWEKVVWVIRITRLEHPIKNWKKSHWRIWTKRFSWNLCDTILPSVIPPLQKVQLDVVLSPCVPVYIPSGILDFLFSQAPKHIYLGYLYSWQILERTMTICLYALRFSFVNPYSPI